MFMWKNTKYRQAIPYNPIMLSILQNLYVFWYHLVWSWSHGAVCCWMQQ